MIDLKDFSLSHSHLQKIAKIERFCGYWNGVEKYTTGLNLVPDYALHGQKFHAVFSQLSARTITTDHVLAIYKNMIAKDKNADWRQEPYSDFFYNSDNEAVGAIETSSPDKIKDELDVCLQNTQRAIHDNNGIHPLIIIAQFTGTLFTIAPFDKGSQKLTVLLAQVLMFQAGYTYSPYSSLDAAVKNHAELICTSLKKGLDSQKSFAEWFNVFLDILVDHANDLKQSVDGQTNDTPHLDPLSTAIMLAFQNHKNITTKILMKETKGKRATIKTRLADLIDKGYIKRYGAGRSVYYMLA